MPRSVSHYLKSSDAAPRQAPRKGYDDDEGKEFGKVDPNAPPFVPSKGLTDQGAFPATDMVAPYADSGR